MVELEICVAADDVSDMKRDIRSALAGGAQRIELCCGMQYDGLTPHREAIEQARAMMPGQTLMVMIRPRPGRFVYSDQEHEHILVSIQLARLFGADGVVFGALNDHQKLHQAQLDELVSFAKGQGLNTTFHRAFDALVGQKAALRRLSEVGVDRVLTSGTSWESQGSAVEGLDQLRSLYLMDETMELVVAGGVNPENARELLTGLLPHRNKLSLHAYSGVKANQKVDQGRVSALAQICSEF